MRDQGRSHETGNEYESTLDRLRGTNFTPVLADLIEASTQWGLDQPAGSGMSVRQHAIFKLQEWAKNIDEVIRHEASFQTPRTAEELLQIMTRLTESGKLRPSLDFSSWFKYRGKIRIPAYDQWNLITALFGINMSGLEGSANGGRAAPRLHKFYEVHEYMFKLIEAAAKKQGGIVEDLTSPSEHQTGFETRSAPTVIPGIQAMISVWNTNLDNAWGRPYITKVYLPDIGLNYLARIRPLPAFRFNSYWHTAERPGQTGGSGYGDSKKKDSQKSTGQEQRTEERPPEQPRPPHDPKGYFRTFGLDPGISDDLLETILKGVYGKLAKRYHPDIAGKSPDSTAKMQALNEAFGVLSDPEKRRRYRESGH